MEQMLSLKPRQGGRPETTQQLPHQQLTQHGPDSIVQQLHDWAFRLEGVNNEQSGIALEGSRALVMQLEYDCNPAAFMIGREFAHIHDRPDNGSMHLMLPVSNAREVKSKGWGEDHYLVTQGRWAEGLVLVFSPRNEEELEVLKSILQRSYDFANKIS